MALPAWIFFACVCLKDLFWNILLKGHLHMTEIKMAFDSEDDVFVDQ